jgi:hypothetical protein
MTEHERFLIRSCLRHLACLEEELDDLDAEIVRRMRMPPFENAFALMQTLPGVGELSAAAILAETGTDVASFPTAEQMASWAGLCPGNRESAGHPKRQSHHARQRVFENRACTMCVVRQSQARIRVRRAVPTSCNAPRTKEFHCGGRTSHVDHYLLHAQSRRIISGRRGCPSAAAPAASGASSLALSPPPGRNGAGLVRRPIRQVYLVFGDGPKHGHRPTTSQRSHSALVAEVDAQTLARLARIDPQLLRPIQHRSEKAQTALMVIRVRAALISARTSLVNTARGLPRQWGSDCQSVTPIRWEFHKPSHCRRTCNACWSRC